MMRITVKDAGTNKLMQEFSTRAFGLVLVNDQGGLTLVGGLPASMAAHACVLIDETWVRPSVRQKRQGSNILPVRMIPGNGEPGP